MVKKKKENMKIKLLLIYICGVLSGLVYRKLYITNEYFLMILSILGWCSIALFIDNKYT